MVTEMVSALVTANELLQKCAWYLDSCLLPQTLLVMVSGYGNVVMTTHHERVNERVNEVQST